MIKQFQARQVQKYILFPFFFTLFPIVSLYGHNVAQVSATETVRALLVCLLVTGCLLAVLGLVVRDFNRAGLAVLGIALLFFSFGHVYTWLVGAHPGSIWSRANLITAVWAAGLIVLPWAFLRLLPGRVASELTPILNVVGLALLVFAAFPLVTFTANNVVAGSSTHKIAVIETPAFSAAPESPDIYYIILDSYGRADVLRELYGIHTNPFLDFLSKRGFYIASGHSNYWRTALSLSSSLNYDYVDNLLNLSPASRDTTPLETLIKENRLMRDLKDRGYTTVAFSTGFGFTEMKTADVFYQDKKLLNSFEDMLVRNSMLILWLDQLMPELHRQQVHANFSILATLPALPGPKVVFAHFVIPHPPFVFDENGGRVTPLGSGDGVNYLGSRQSYLDGYRAQLLYTNKLVEKAVEAILDQSSSPPVIIIQGDHGPGAYFDSNAIERSCLRERYSILNAYFLPGKTAEEVGLYPGISPVNSFRVILNAYFDTNLPLLDDLAYYSIWNQPYDMVEVTDRLGECISFPPGALKEQP